MTYVEIIDADRVPDPNVLVHRKRGQTDETMDLHRITHSIGFPMAPKAEGLAKDSVEDDLVALGVSYILHHRVCIVSYISH